MKPIQIKFTCKDIPDADVQQFLHDYRIFFKILYQDRNIGNSVDALLSIAKEAATESIYYLQQQYSKDFKITTNRNNGSPYLKVSYFNY